MKKTFAVVIAICLMTLAGSAFGQVTNGGFETGNFTGWSQFGNTGFTGVNGSSANTGSFGAFFGPVGSTGGISQDIATTIGSSYLVTFALQHDGGTPNSIAVSFGGVTYIGATDAGGFPYTTFSFVTSSATGALETLAFEFRQDPAYYRLDDVTVTETPEPGSLALLGSGLLGLGGAVRRKLIAR